MNMYGNGEKKRKKERKESGRSELPENGTVRNPAVITCIYIYIKYIYVLFIIDQRDKMVLSLFFLFFVTRENDLAIYHTRDSCILLRAYLNCADWLEDRDSI